MIIEEIRKRHESNDLWIEADTDGWQAHKDRGVLLERIAELEHQLAGCTCPTVALLRRPEVCPKCNQEMGNPHHCRPNWSGESIKGD